jgi:hypothetical protein
VIVMPMAFSPFKCHCEERSDPRIKPEGRRGNPD